MDSAGQSCDERDEARLFFRRFAWREQVGPSVGVDTPVAVLARAVEPSKGLLVRERLDSVFHRQVFHDFERQSVLVGGDVGQLEDGTEFNLRGGHLIVEGDHRNARAPQSLLELVEKRARHRRNFIEVVVVSLLTPRRRSTNECATCCDQVRASLVQRAINNKELLLPPDVGDHTLGLRVAKGAQQADAIGAHGVLRPEHNGLFVEGVALVRNEPRGNIQRVVAHKRGRRRVPVHERRGAVGDAQAAVGERRPVGFVVEQASAGEVGHRVLQHTLELPDASVVVVDHRVVFETVGAADGREPVGVLASAARLGPPRHAGCELVGRGFVHFRASEASVLQGFQRRVVQRVRHGVVVEPVDSEVGQEGALVGEVGGKGPVAAAAAAARTCHGADSELAGGGSERQHVVAKWVRVWEVPTQTEEDEQAKRLVLSLTHSHTHTHTHTHTRRDDTFRCFRRRRSKATLSAGDLFFCPFI